MRIILIALVLSGCASAPDSSLRGMKEQQRWEVYKECRQVFRDSRSAGVILVAGDEFFGCQAYANSVVR